MPKRKSSSISSKKPSQVKERPVIPQSTKKVPKAGKFGREIDDIFALIKNNKLEVQIPETKETKAEIARKKRKRDKLARNTTPDGLNNRRPRKTTPDGFSNSANSRPRKRTADGWPVFTEDEIGFNKANSGDTPLCPFDCNCCF